MEPFIALLATTNEYGFGRYLEKRRLTQESYL